MVTSSAVVGSSAIRISGSQTSAIWASNRLSTPARKKCIFSRKKFVQPVRSVLVRTCTANRSKLKRGIVYISCSSTPYRPYGLFEVRTQFFQMRTEQSSSHCANLIVALPQETFPLGESSKSPLHFAAHRDESVIGVKEPAVLWILCAQASAPLSSAPRGSCSEKIGRAHV